MTILGKAVVATGIAAAVYALVVQPRLVRWGATDAEVAERFPGAELLAGGKRAATMAITIKTTPERVWPWLVQMGGGRGGWYSWDRLDNASLPSATQVHPEWQTIAVGDQVEYQTGKGPIDAWVVAAIEPNRFFALRGVTDGRGAYLDPATPRPSAYSEGIWGFQLKPLEGGRTRLIIGGYQTFRPRWSERVVTEVLLPIVWIMQARMLAVLKRSIERAV